MGSTRPSTWVTSPILEAAQHMDDRIHFADVGEELIAQPFAFRRAAHQAGNVDEFELSLDHAGALRDLGDLLQARVRDGHAADIGLDRAKGVIGRLRRRRFGERIEQGGLADIRQPDDTATKTHSNPLEARCAGPNR
jgi:hypothetical protein